MHQTIWSPLPGYEGRYEISASGCIKSLARSVKWGAKHLQTQIIKERILRHWISTTGYKKVILAKEGKYKRMHIHILIAKTFIPNPFNKPFVNHIDGDKLNNRVSNLEWCTAKENSQHAIKLGLWKPKKGIDSSNSVLTEDQVMEIFNSSLPQYEIAKKFNICKQNVSCIKIGTSWSHLTGKQYKRVRSK